MKRSRHLPPAALMLSGLALALSASLALAERDPGPLSGPNGAITARTIGLLCADSLSNDDIYDLDVYLSWKRVASAKTNSPDARQEWLGHAELEHDVMAKYRDPKACTKDATDMARNMLGRVRQELSGSCTQDGCFDP